MQTHSVHLMVQSKKPTPKKNKKAVVPKAKAKTKSGQKRVKPVVVEINYRPRTPEDDSFIVSLTQGQLGSIHEQAFGQPFPEDQFLRYIQSGAPTIVIEKNGKAIGYYSYLVGPDAKMHVSAMVIDAKNQSSGIGKMVMTKLEEDARKLGVRTLEVFVQENNAQSLAFTRSLGFREVFRIEPNTMAFQKQLVPLPPMGMQPQYAPQF